MVKRQKKIVVWIITWAGLLLLVLYSPIGSPDLYTSRKYFTANQGVQFNGAGIENAPTIKTVGGNNNPGLNVPVSDVPELKNNTNYTVSTPDNSTPVNSGSSYSSESSLPAQKSGNSEGGSGGIGGSMGSIIGKTSKESTPGTGFMALSTDLNGLTGNSLPQGASGSLSTGATDPGNDSPLGDPIPVGDGWGLFILFGVGYALLKKRVFTEKKI